MIVYDNIENEITYSECYLNMKILQIVKASKEVTIVEYKFKLDKKSQNIESLAKKKNTNKCKKINCDDKQKEANMKKLHSFLIIYD